MSTRNGYLSAEQKAQAAALYQSLQEAAAALRQHIGIASVEAAAAQKLAAAGFVLDYFSVCHTDTLEPAQAEDRRLVILAAAWLGKTRLIDNLQLELPPA